MSGAQKKVIVRLHTGAFHAGYLSQRDFVAERQVELLEISGVVKSFALKDIRHIAYVTDFNLSSVRDPENIGRSAFLAKPRGTGLWLRATFRDDTTLEGLAAADIRFADELAADQGVFLTPPDPRSNAHRVYIPREAMVALELLAVIGAGAHPRQKPAAAERSQPSLFEDR